MPYRDEREDQVSKRGRRAQPISRLLPNMITIASLCCGLSAIRFALPGTERWELSVGFILAAALLDGMDGRIARLLGATSIFGAQLDSLSDFVCFGVAPAMVMYMWGLHDIRGFGWAMSLFFIVCTALRLARFNTGLFNTDTAPWQKKFFTGVPSPAGGILCLFPLILTLQTDEYVRFPTLAVGLYVVCIGMLMASRIPTFAAKDIRIQHDMILPITTAGALLVVLFIIEPWWTITTLSIVYLASIIFSVRRYRQLKAEHAASPQP